MAVPRITKEELKQRLDGPAELRPVVIDARLKYPYEHSTVRLPGAIRMMPGALDPSQLSRDREIVVYDSDPEELVSAGVAAELNRQGFRAAALIGGIGDWMAGKLPVETKSAPQPAPIAAGSLKA
ncbi:MAG TPA: rhodanese-like domain-containing protein [Vicinamibacterales bacterium]|nr:rhodanese-like domain-containing protein [Vicinamibacterales bacterium]